MQGRGRLKSADCLTAHGVDLDGYTMLKVIEDNEAVGRTPGCEHINLLNESHGTRVAFLCSLRHPESVFRSALTSVNPPGRFVWEPRVIEAQLKQ